MSSFDWFSATFGFAEFDKLCSATENGQRVRSKFTYDAATKALTSTENGNVFHGAGNFSLPSLSELRREVEALEVETNGDERMTFENISGDVREITLSPSSAGAVFQAASQFNCLEMLNSHVTPEEGIECYAMDRTQGPISAMCAPGGTLWRNYFVQSIPGFEDGGPGQTQDRQIDTVAALHTMLKEHRLVRDDGDGDVWEMSNGYMMPASATSIMEVGRFLKQQQEEESELMQECRDVLRVGVQWDVETSSAGKHRVAQVYCSGCPVNYDRITDPIACKESSDPRAKVPFKKDIWAPLASLILEATYEATFLCAGLLALRAGNGARRTLYLTKVGGGVFGNSDSWIVSAISRCVKKYKRLPIDVKVVHYGSIPSSGGYTSIQVQ